MQAIHEVFSVCFAFGLSTIPSSVTFCVSNGKREGIASWFYIVLSIAALSVLLWRKFSTSRSRGRKSLAENSAIAACEKKLCPRLGYAPILFYLSMPTVTVCVFPRIFPT
jgi:hypothetical protein